MGKSIEQHYSTSNLLERIFGALVMEGKDPFSLAVDDLSAVDEFHSRGRHSTVELARLATPKSTEKVLDAGCGLGGSARFLANSFGCRVTGVDLTPEYIKVATRLTELVGLNDRCTFVLGSVTDLPFDAASFDLVWTEHAQMNIQDKQRFYREIARVLKPGGRLVFHDVFARSGKPTFPLPWADQESISFLCTEDDAREFILQAGFEIPAWDNKVEESLEAFTKAVENQMNGEPQPLGIHLLMGNTARKKIANYLQCMQDGAISVSMGLAVKRPSP